MAGVLLALRPPNNAQNASQSAVVFERLCAESFVYYSTLMMLFDPSLDVLYRTNPTIDLDRYFSDFADGGTVMPGMLTAAQPVLHASYKFFLLVADVTRLARIPHPFNEVEVGKWEHIHADLLRWEGALHDDPSAMLYILAMRILLLKVDPTASILESTEQMHCLLQHGLRIMSVLDLRSYFLVYLLWPLAVFGSVAVEHSDRRVVGEQVSVLTQTRHGQPLRVKKLMEVIWSANDGGQEDGSTVILRQLRMLLEGTQYTLSIGRDELMSTESE
ncbi:hypothetical protein PHISP_00039 [Aspergillus sp. HF37]|nr:hypothetical protein PHISP_00039 [Aspergillus sp. HF37]